MIQSITQLRVLIPSVVPPSPGNPSVVLIDFDHVLAMGTGLANEDVYKFIKEENGRKGFPNRDAHYEFMTRLREETPYSSCEPVSELRDVIERIRGLGALVYILTSRGIDMERCTILHLRTASLPFSIDDVIFKLRKGDGKLESKAESFLRKLSQVDVLNTASNISVVFADDSMDYCENMRTLSTVGRISIRCFHYVRCEPNPRLSQERMRRLTVQAHALMNGKMVSDDEAFSDEHVAAALIEFGMSRMDSEQLHLAIMKLAEKIGTPFRVGR